MVVVSLFCSALWDLLGRRAWLWHQDVPFVPRHPLVRSSYMWVEPAVHVFTDATPFVWSNWSCGKNLILLLATVPTAYTVLNFVWDFQIRRGSALSLIAPLNLLVLATADLLSVQLLAGMALLGAAAQMYISSNIRRDGMKVI